MKIILKEDIANLGYKDDVVDVKDGYGRNYLIPQSKAVVATKSALKVLAEDLRQRAQQRLRLMPKLLLPLLTGLRLLLLQKQAKTELFSVLLAHCRFQKPLPNLAMKLTANLSPFQL